MKGMILGWGLTLILAMAICAPRVEAQGGTGRGMGQRRGPGAMGRMYDPKTEQTLSGQVQSVERLTSPRGRAAGIHLVLKTDQGTTQSVQLGPSWYIDKQQPKIEQGDKISVTGSKVTLRNRPVLIARLVKKGDKELVLRDSTGVPVWAGRGRGMAPRTSDGSTTGTSSSKTAK